MSGLLKRLHILLCCLIFSLAFAKTYGQKVSPEAFSAWAARNNFVSGTDWRDHLDLSPGNMGPNALPVMQSIRGEVDSVASFRIGGNYHTAPGDRTTDLALELRYPFGDRASLRIRYVLVERYSLSEELALSRNVLREDLDGVAHGDVTVDGLFQLIKGHAKFPDFTVAIRVKTASGTDLEGLRNTDTPGYAFEGSFGKDFVLPKGDIVLRPYASGGFFVWQLFGAEATQNDAYTYSVGLAQRFAKVNSFVEWAGYSGWMQELDQPMVIRGGVRTNGRLAYTLDVSQGLRNWEYFTIGLGLKYGW